MNDGEYDRILDVEGQIDDLAAAYEDLEQKKLDAISGLSSLSDIDNDVVIGVIGFYPGLDSYNNCESARDLLRESRK